MDDSKTLSRSEQWMTPLLDALKALDGSGKPREVSTKIAEMLNLSEDTLNDTLPSGVQRFHNSICWTRNYLVYEGYIDSSVRGVWILTEKGRSAVLSDEDTRAIVRKWTSHYRNLRASKEPEGTATVSEAEVDLREQEEAAAADTDLLRVLRSMSPTAFERVCARLLRESGFENVTVTGRSHDGGIDGEGSLAINPFLTLKVVFQCKRYKGAVSREQVSDFENRAFKTADKGIFITTGYFSVDAIREAQNGGKRQLELIDGEKLVEMFKRTELGLRPVVVYEVDHAFFRQFEDGE